MNAKVRARRVATKTSDSRLGNPIPQKGNQISPVMQKVKSLLPAQKAAFLLAGLIEEKVEHCQKLLCGERVENAQIVGKLLRSWMGQEVLLVIQGEDRSEWPDWFARHRKQLDVNDARRKLAETQRAIERLQSEASS